MPRLRNTETGVVVSVSKETAEALVGSWEPADKPAPAAAKKSATEKKS